MAAVAYNQDNGIFFTIDICCDFMLQRFNNIAQKNKNS